MLDEGTEVKGTQETKWIYELYIVSLPDQQLFPLPSYITDIV